MGLFTNGNARVTRLIIWQLGLSSLSMVIIQVQGFLPSLDFISPKALKITSFSLSVALSLNEAGKMFFNRTATLLKGADQQIPPVTTATVTGGSAEVLTKP